MTWNLPIVLDDVLPGDADKDVLRAAIVTALDALHRYQDMASMAGDERIRKLLLEGAREEGGRVRELGTILLREERGDGNL
jgi:rubrerythrin